MPPILSIITPTYNRGHILQTAIQSVYAQGINDLEFIIMDGGSTDNTREIVRQYPEIRFYSEPDNGLYFALNKGLQLARGKYIGWLNSDDYYPPGAFQAALSLFAKDPELMGVFGIAEVISTDPQKPNISIPAFQQEKFFQKVSSDSFSMNASLLKREALTQLNGFDTRYKIAADRDFMFRFGLAGFRYSSVEATLYCYQESSTSLTFSKNVNGKVNGDFEEMQMAKNYLQDNLSVELNNICQDWHSRASADACLISLGQWKIKAATDFMRDGLALDKKWGGFFLRGLLLKTIRRIFSPKARARFGKYKNILGY
jgi:glycosyltransferase involved in cell wall biosynthesis